jgi:Tfp pilus assembly pilus retraction ATPase PilT
MLPSLGIDTWEDETLPNLAAEILRISPKPLIFIDGKGGSGKTSFAAKLANVLGANIVATDDVAWYADPIHWDEELLAGIINPWLGGENVA